MEGEFKPAGNENALLAAYAEVCKSYNSLNDASNRLLGLVPFTSLITIILLDNNLLTNSAGSIAKELIGFGSIFVIAIVIALFSFEIRSIERCDRLMREGEMLEKELKLKHGQFTICNQRDRQFIKVFNANNATCFIYSLVIAGWIFVALRVGFDVAANVCIIWSTLVALTLGFVMATVVRGFLPR